MLQNILVTFSLNVRKCIGKIFQMLQQKLNRNIFQMFIKILIGNIFRNDTNNT